MWPPVAAWMTENPKLPSTVFQGSTETETGVAAAASGSSRSGSSSENTNVSSRVRMIPIDLDFDFGSISTRSGGPIRHDTLRFRQK